jgi:uncharacterized protein (TIRG00374 family)
VFSRRHAQVAGVVVGLATLGLLGYVLGFTDVVETLESLSPRQVLLLGGLGLVPVVLWGVALWFALDAIGVSTSLGRAVLLFGVSLFFNGVTPFGQAGGAPLSSGVIAHAVRTPYEQALAALSGLDALNKLATVLLWLLGGASLAAGTDIAGAREAVVVTGVVVVVATAALIFLWRAHDRFIDGVTAGLTRLLALASRVVPGWSPPPPDAVADRVDGFVEAVGRLAGSRRRLVAISVLAVAGQLVVVLLLYLSLSLFSDPSLAAVLFVVPLSRVAATVPTPGGLGSTEALLTGLLVTVAGTTPVVAGAVAVVYRLTAFWIPGLLGGVAAVGLLFESRR